MIEYLYGKPVIVSIRAVETVPVRVHKKRRNQSWNYHDRIQKKWFKRWGSHEVPRLYHVDGRPYDLAGRQVLVVHPTIYAKLREAAEQFVMSGPAPMLKIYSGRRPEPGQAPEGRLLMETRFMPVASTRTVEKPVPSSLALCDLEELELRVVANLYKSN